MTTLRAAQYEAMLDFLAEAASAESTSSFPDDVLGAMRRAVPCDAISYREWTGERVVDSSLAAVDADARVRVWSAYARFRGDDPIPGGPAGGGAQQLPTSEMIGRPLAFSDLMSDRRFRATGLYAEICKPLEVRAVMKLFLPTEGQTGAAFVFDTSRSRFTETDREILVRLLPHLVQLRRTAHLQAQAPAVLARLTPRERVVLARAAAGETNEDIARALFLSVGTVRKHLEHIYEKLEVRNRAAATAIYSRSPSSGGFHPLRFGRGCETVRQAQD